MDTLKFLQISQPANNGTRALWLRHLPAAKCHLLQDDLLRPFRAIADLARAEGVAAVFFTGGLWTGDEVPPATAREIYEILESLAPAPVLVVPDASDSTNPYSCYSARYYERETGARHPGNVTFCATTAAFAETAATNWPSAVTAEALKVFVAQEPAKVSPDRTCEYSAMTALFERGALLPDSVRNVSLAPRRQLDLNLTIDASLRSPAELAEEIAKALDQVQAGTEDLIRIELHGSASPELLALPWDLTSAVPLQKFVFLVVNALSLQPSRSVLASGDSDPVRRIERRFLERLVSMQPEEAEPAVRLEAARTGLQALRSGQVYF